MRVVRITHYSSCCTRVTACTSLLTAHQPRPPCNTGSPVTSPRRLAAKFRRPTRPRTSRTPSNLQETWTGRPRRYARQLLSIASFSTRIWRPPTLRWPQSTDRAGRTRRAAQFDRLALDLKQKVAGPDDPATISFKNIVALHQQEAGQFAEAERTLREIAESLRRRRGPDHLDYADALVQLAGCQAAAGRNREAEGSLELALAIYRKTPSPRRHVSALLEQAKLLTLRKQETKALGSFKAALDIIVAAGLSGSEVHARALESLGDLARKLGDKVTAQRSLTEALETLRGLKAAGSPLAISCIKALAAISAEAGDYAGGLKLVEQGLTAFTVSDPVHGTSFRSRDEVVDVLDLKGEYLLRTDLKSPAAWKRSYEALAAAGEVTDRVRAEQRSSEMAKGRVIDRSRYEAVMLRINLCEMLVGAEPGPKWLGEAFRTSEESKARVFLEQLGRNRSAVIGDLPEEIATKESALRAKLVQLDREVSSFEVASFDRREPAKVAELLAESSRVERQMDELQHQIARDYPLAASFRRPNPCSPEQARDCLGPDEVAVIYVCGGRLCDALVVNPQADKDPIGISLVPIPGPETFTEALGLLTDPDALQVREFYEKAGAELYRALIAPVEDRVRGKNLVIVPDGQLALLPFEALRDPSGRFLIETHRIRYAPSLTVLHLNKTWEAKRRRPSRPILGVGDPIYTITDPRLEGRTFSPRGRRTAERLGEDLPRLISASREVSEAGQALGAPIEDIWTGRDASETRLKTASARNQLLAYRFVHIATHGLLGAGPGRPPALVLSLAGDEPGSSQPEDDGLLTIGEVSALRLNADLIVLSGCRTGRGEVSAGEGVTGIARAFLCAGTRAVICSLWTVDDVEAARTMTDMYQRLAAGRETAVALREAKLKMILAGWPPSRWAPFILIGQ